VGDDGSCTLLLSCGSKFSSASGNSYPLDFSPPTQVFDSAE